MVNGLLGHHGPFVHQHVKTLKVECKLENEVALSPSLLLEGVNV